MRRLASQLAAVQQFVLRDSSVPVAGVAGTRSLSRGKRLGIYRDAYFLRLYEVLSSSYAALKILLGDRFDELAAIYTAQHRSKHFSIRYYGDGLAKLLSSDARFKSEPVLAEVAAWEWAMAHAFDAADATPVEFAALSKVPPHLWAGVTFGFHPSIKVQTARWNSVTLWQAANHGEALPAYTRNANVKSWVVWRRDLDVLFERIERNERDALRLARRSGTFAEICACAPDTLLAAEQATWAVQLIQRWVVRGWIVELVASRSVR